ncbi:hypothetical protein HRM2_43190 [Desulforapulum autotrophicum HRM2]|uniref:Uncharacterized protein n=1 Tax=Desulforapulum autotrophicum (strain ATCC 43914 / DSM 3382 / VKM B-1955 / HRM2) TaxID=177437 RepID=C0QDV4_DESAH|nr:hypothetical protein HRM2_43190 [Desulforapulum autotrophicum HRM2]
MVKAGYGLLATTNNGTPWFAMPRWAFHIKSDKERWGCIKVLSNIQIGGCGFL